MASVVYGPTGINFSDYQTPTSSATMVSELLDSYEEGTWAPTMLIGSISSNVNARYQKIGTSVSACITTFDTATSSDSSNNQGVQNLPFTCGDVYYAGCSLNNVAAAQRHLLIIDATTSFWYAANTLTSSKADAVSAKTFYGWYVHYSTLS